MADAKSGAVRTFRPRPKTAERLEFADTLGLNVSKLVNDCLEDHLRDYLASEIEAQKAEIENKRKVLREALEAPLP